MPGVPRTGPTGALHSAGSPHAMPRRVRRKGVGHLLCAGRWVMAAAVARGTASSRSTGA